MFVTDGVEILNVCPEHIDGEETVPTVGGAWTVKVIDWVQDELPEASPERETVYVPGVALAIEIL